MQTFSNRSKNNIKYRKRHCHERLRDAMLVRATYQLFMITSTQ